MTTVTPKPTRGTERQAAPIPKSPAVNRPGPASSKGSGAWRIRVLLGIGAVVVLGTMIPLLLRAVKPKEIGPTLTHTIKRGDLVVVVTEEGTLESSNNQEIKCRVKGGSTVLWVIETGTQVEPGDEVVRLDTSSIEDNISQQEIAYENALANKIISEANVAFADTSITEYLEGTYREERNTIENEIFVAEEDLKRAQLSLESVKRLVARGLLSNLQLEGEEYGVEAAEKVVALARQRLNALDKFTKEKNLTELKSNLKAAEARLASDKAALKLEKDRLDRARAQLENCVIKSESSGMVIFPSAAEWKEAPDIEEGATVREQQTLLVIPDLNQMQVKVGIHESKVDRLNIGMRARIELQDQIIEGEVASVASVTRPAGWWTGNVVKYDTIIKLDPQPGLKPGMSAVVEVYLARHDDVLTIPVAAVVEHAAGYFCWVTTSDGIQRRSIELGDSNDEFLVVNAGLKEGDEVVLNPLAYVEEAQLDALRPASAETTDASDDGAKPYSGKPGAGKPGAGKPGLGKPDAGKSGAGKSGAGTPGAGKPTAEKPGVGKPGAKPGTASAMKVNGDQIIKMADKNSDGVLTEDEFTDKDRANFSKIDTNNDAQVDAGEIEAAIQSAQQAQE